MFAPICAIQIVDYYFFRHQRLDMLSLFDYSPKGRYHFWGGFNPAAFIATAVGCLTYWYLLDPVTYVSHNTTAFKWMSASMPTLAVVRGGVRDPDGSVDQAAAQGRLRLRCD